MTRVEDMSETQRRAWATLLVDGFVFFYFIQKMTSGMSINDYSPEGLVGIFVSVIIATIIMHAVIASVFAARGRQEDADVKDERDIDIERKGASYGFYFLAIFMNIIVGQLLLESTLKGYEGAMVFGNTSHLFFVLVSAAFIGDIIKNGVMILAYRGH